MPLRASLVERIEDALSGSRVDERRFRAGFRHRSESNLTRECDGDRVTVFARRAPEADDGDDPRYGFVIENEDGEKRWSPSDGYDTEDEAVAAARDELNG